MIYKLLRIRLPFSVNRTTQRHHIHYDGLRLLLSQTDSLLVSPIYSHMQSYDDSF